MAITDLKAFQATKYDRRQALFQQEGEGTLFLTGVLDTGATTNMLRLQPRYEHLITALERVPIGLAGPTSIEATAKGIIPTVFGNLDSLFSSDFQVNLISGMSIARLGLTGTINSNGIRYHTSEGHEVLNAFVDGEDYIIRLPLL